MNYTELKAKVGGVAFGRFVMTMRKDRMMRERSGDDAPGRCMMPLCCKVVQSFDCGCDDDSCVKNSDRDGHMLLCDEHRAEFDRRPEREQWAIEWVLHLWAGPLGRKDSEVFLGEMTDS